jgi:hypothetical protein
VIECNNIQGDRSLGIEEEMAGVPEPPMAGGERLGNFFQVGGDVSIAVARFVVERRSSISILKGKLVYDGRDGF